jgi:signal transduction histidine kinase
MTTFSRLSLSRQFLLASFPILLVGMAVIGWWVGEKIEHGVLHRLGSVTSHYVESFISPHLQSLSRSPNLDDPDRAALNSLLTETPLGQKIVSFKIWDRSGRIVYSTDSSMIGRTFPIGEGLRAALDGIVHSEVSHLTEAENVVERRKWPRLIETYSPIHAEKLGTVIAAAEFYQTPDELFREIRLAQLQSWLVVAASMLVMYLLIFGVVRRGSQTIDAQQRQLSDQISKLSAVVAQNTQLHERVQRAAVRTTALNERFLRRIAADLHDGPGQDLALALMRFETIADTNGACPVCGAGHGYTRENCRAIYTSLQSALTELRAISLGLQLPEIERLQSTEVAERAVRDFARKTSTNVALATPDQPAELPLPVKITLYRLIQESLANGFRHGGGAAQSVTLTRTNGQLRVTVSDEGVGFDPQGAPAAGGSGLEGMRERVEILGGTFDLRTAPGQGTVIQANLPLELAGIGYE